MKIKNTLYILLLVLFSSFDYPAIESYTKLDDGLLVRLEKKKAGAPRYVKLRVISEKIIQVLSGPGMELTAPTSLMVVDQPNLVADWKLKEQENALVLNTTALRVKVDGVTGAVTFFDQSGNRILQESDDNHGERAFLPVQYEEGKSYRIQKVFNVAEREAFYGLGQHQTGIMNYRGYQVDLTQYNSVAIVPFLVSSKNYGILWDNNSITKAGDIREYQPLSGFTLYSKDQVQGGLTATYVSGGKHKQPSIVRKENTIDYEFLSNLQQLPEGYSLEGGRVTWEGYIESDTSGAHTFSITSSGYVKVWIDEKLLMDKWRESWNPGPAVFRHVLEKGKKHPVKISWDPDGGQAFIAARFLPPLPEEEKNTFAFASESGDVMNYYFIKGEDMDEVISGYRQLTGSAQIMPKWAMGFWQSRERYKTQEELLDVVSEYRKRGIGLDNIVLDWSYWEEDAWGSHEFDKERFPDPAGMIETLHDKYNVRIMISVWPKFYKGIEHYKEFNKNGLLYTQNILDGQKDWIGEGYVSTFYDAFDPRARQLFWHQMNEHLYAKGVDAWWLDATEPDILSNASIERRKKLMNPTFLGPAEKYFNAYSLVNAKGIYEGQRAEDPNARVFILTRSAFAGLQHYGAATWSGDISATFRELGRQIPAGLNFSLSGLPYWTTDIGGFFVEDKYDRPDPQGAALEEWRELNTRWYQFAAFTPLFRSHGQYPYRELFNIAPEGHKAYQSMVYYNTLRYRLMPYLYSLAGKVYFDDYTIMRALVMDFGADKKVWEIGDQFMFGPNLLISPVYTYKARKRRMYLPASTGWYNLYDGTFQQGGRYLEAEAPYGRIPVFVKEGAIIPFGPDIAYSTEKPADTLTLYVYGGQDAHFELYEDENTNYNYEKGKYTIIPITYDDAGKTLTIGDKQGKGFQGMLEGRIFHIIYINRNNPRPLRFDAKPDKVIEYSGKAQFVILG